VTKAGSKPKQSGVERVVAPVAGLVVVVSAMVAAARGRRDGVVDLRDRPPASAAAQQDAEVARAGGLKAKLQRFTDKVPPLRYALAVQKRYGELRGNNIASAVTFQAFVSIFPLLIFLTGVIGFVTQHADVDVSSRIVANLGLEGDAASAIHDAVDAARDSRRAASVIGLAGLLWSGLGLVNALQYALNQAWQVEERGIKDKAVGVVWLMGALLTFVGASAVTTVLNWLPGAAAPAGIAVGLGVNLLLWLWTFRVLPNRSVPWRALVPGAVLGAVGMEALKLLGGIYVPRAVASSSQLYGSLGVVFAVLAWLLFFGRLIMYAATLNVVLWERKAGTIRTVVEVPGGADVSGADDVTRTARVEKHDVRA
jgi:membrane protein